VFGVSSKTPGHEMQVKGLKKGHPGASGYSGREMQAKGSKKGHPGPSGMRLVKPPVRVQKATIDEFDISRRCLNVGLRDVNKKTAQQGGLFLGAG
jgi:hypothetical protein